MYVICYIIFFQSLSMNNAARVESTVGEIVNLMSVDAENVRHNFHMTWAIITCPLSIIVSLLMLYNEVRMRKSISYIQTRVKLPL